MEMLPLLPSRSGAAAVRRHRASLRPSRAGLKENRAPSSGQTARRRPQGAGAGVGEGVGAGVLGVVGTAGGVAPALGLGDGMT
ncbi:hypothetical protein GCM10022215_00900 [Nocardioides fonticola]|uniref:Uncharacterized protein n=1 Tax=Nocardioides fonticola TaxID=450363 RepID=A0ABP7X8Y5_9ACTN